MYILVGILLDVIKEHLLYKNETLLLRIFFFQFPTFESALYVLLDGSAKKWKLHLYNFAAFHANKNKMLYLQMCNYI